MLNLNGSGVVPRALMEAAAGLHARLRACDSVTRLEIIMLLMAGPRRVGELADGASLGFPQVSYHLNALKREGLVVCRAEGNERHYSLSRVFGVRRAEGRWKLTIAAWGGATITIAVPDDVVEEDRAGIVRTRVCVDVGEPMIGRYERMIGRDGDGLVAR